jgi:serine protease Do
MAKHLGDEDLTGFRVTQVFEGNTAAKAGLQVGDIIVSVDGYELEASAPEDSEELPMYIRQYSPGTEAEFVVLRGEERVTLPIEIIRAPMLAREVSKFRDENFGFTVREITYLDTVEEEWKEDQEGVLVSEVTSGGWASLAGLNVGDLILRVNGDDVLGLEQFKATMDGLAHEKPETAVLVVRRGIYRKYVEIEPDWE